MIFLLIALCAWFVQGGFTGAGGDVVLPQAAPITPPPVVPQRHIALLRMDLSMTLQPQQKPLTCWALFTSRGYAKSQTRIRLRIDGLAPNSIHAFHIHELGVFNTAVPGRFNCSMAQGHYNPYKVIHGGPRDTVRHVGDLGNFRVNRYGVATLDIKNNLVKLTGQTSVVGRTLVIHEKPDDLGRGVGALKETSQKVGNAGKRLMCGVIGNVEPV